MKKHLGLVLLLAYSTLRAEPLDLAACFSLARQQSQALQNAQLDLRMARIGMTLAAAPFYPHLSVQGSQTLAGDSLSGQRIEDPVRWTTDTYRANAVATWNLFRSGRDWLGLRQAVAGHDQTRADLRRQEQELALQVLQEYLNVLKQKKLVALAQKNLLQRQERQAQVKSLYGSGSASYVGVLGQQVQVTAAERGLSNQRTQSLEAQARFRSMLGQDPNGEIDLVDSLGNTLAAPDEAQSRAIALKRRDDLAAWRSNLSVHEDALRLAWINRLPSFGLDFNFNKDISAYGQDRAFWSHPDRGDENASWAAMASVNIPIFQGFALKANADRAAAARDKARLSLQQTERQAILETRLATLALAQRLRNLELDGALVDAATKNLTELQRSYAGGTASLFEVNEADTDLLRAATDQLSGFYDYQVARAQWKRTLGLDLLSAEEE